MLQRRTFSGTRVGYCSSSFWQLPCGFKGELAVKQDVSPSSPHHSAALGPCQRQKGCGCAGVRKIQDECGRRGLRSRSGLISRRISGMISTGTPHSCACSSSSPSGPIARAGDQRNVVAARLHQPAARQQRVFLCSSQNEPRDDVNDFDQRIEARIKNSEFRRSGQPGARTVPAL